MTAPSPHVPAGSRRKVSIVVFMEPDEALPAHATAIGFLLQGSDHVAVMQALQDLCDGHGPCTSTARRVRVTLHEDAETEAHGLSPREREVLCALVRGRSYKMIADELNISFETVRSHIKGIYGKMNVCNNTAAVVKAIQSGLAPARVA